MKDFDVLDSKTEIQGNKVLEASAGTGKTFAIENIVLRLLLENNFNIEQILVVTFTRAAAQELKIRIRDNLEKAIKIIENPEDKNIPDFLQKYLHDKNGRRTIERAFLEQAQVFTIHSFCYKILMENPFDGDLSLNPTFTENSWQFVRVIKDFFRTGLNGEVCTPHQLDILLKKHNNDETALAKAIISLITNGKNITCNSLEKLQNPQQTKPEKIIEDFHKIAPDYTKIYDRSGNMHKLVQDNLELFANLFDRDWGEKEFDQLLVSGKIILNLLDKKKLKKNRSENLPKFFEEARKKLLPIIEYETNYYHLLSRVAKKAQKQLNRFLNEEEILLPDDLLKITLKSLEKDSFAKEIRNRYRAAIIDEFQDTDPVQWKIFERLFLDSSYPGFIYLVGDPKQSIYAFRNADIYTYLQATDFLGKSSKFSLSTNYRSQSALVDALNKMFSSVPDLFNLPNEDRAIDYKEVLSSKTAEILDKKGSIHFFATESKDAEDYLFPYIAKEIQALNDLEVAILVRDRYQARRMKGFLDKLNIPAEIKRTSTIVESPAWQALQEVFAGIIDPRDRSLLKIALSSKIICWTNEDLRNLKDNEEKVILEFFSLRKKWFKDGLLSFWKALLQSPILSAIADSDTMQIIEILAQKDLSPKKTLPFMKEMEHLSTDEDKSLSIKQQEDSSAVKIMTMHACKGLEFDVVFTLGLVNRTPKPSTIINKSNHLTVCQEDSDEYLRFCKEIDAEKMRQLYVAMTRAKKRLYAPIVIDPSQAPKGTASPMEIFLQKLLGSVSYESIKSFANLAEISCELITEKPVVTPKKIEGEKHSVKTEEKPKIEIEPIPIYSFSSLAKKDRHVKLEIPDGILPPSKETGIIVHEIMENISFEDVHKMKSSEELIPSIRPFLDENLSPWEDEIGKMAYNTLKKELHINGQKFSLSQISSYYKEMEFVLKPQNSKLPDGLIAGFIDLVFCHNDLYYVLDWKTNFLPSYDQNQLQKTMEENEYHLQGSIYKTALERHLGKNKKIGGIIYLFMRGINEYNQDGVYVWNS